VISIRSGEGYEQKNIIKALSHTVFNSNPISNNPTFNEGYVLIHKEAKR
jgi:hypothetical protein